MKFLKMNFIPLQNIYVNVQNSYKFYWWLSIIEILTSKNQIVISFDEIVLKSISKLWYPVNYYKLNFGKQDQCSRFIKQIKFEYKLEDNLSEKELYKFLLTIKNHKVITNITNELTRYVPYRFIRPWYEIETRKIRDYLVNNKILELQDSSGPYLIEPDKRKILLNKEWSKWISQNYKLLKGFTYLELIKYLEKNNPLISNLSLKLEKPSVRKLKKPTILWEEFMVSYPFQREIFEKKCFNEIKLKSLDHFFPWSFVTHDLLWNLHPIEKNVNSLKNNLLPHYKYIESFSLLQYRFLNFLLSTNKVKSIEDYNILFGASKEDLERLSEIKFQSELEKHYKPMYEVATNMGFTPNWSFD